MNIISDISTLYGTVRTTWRKIQADVISHIILFTLVFIIFQTTIPTFLLPDFDANIIQENEWYKLAKETGVLYLSFTLPFLIFIIYGSLIRGIGRMLVTTIIILFPMKPLKGLGKSLNAGMLVPLALILRKEEFHLYDLIDFSRDLILRYENKKSDLWQSFQESIRSVNNNATTYLGNFSVFIIAWILLFKLSDGNVWIIENQSKFWPVLISLLAIAVFSGYRVYGLLANITNLQLSFVSHMLKSDPEMEERLNVTEEYKNKIQVRINDLLKKATEREKLKPTIGLYLKLRGFTFFSSIKIRNGPGLLFPKFFKRGESFSIRIKNGQGYYSNWFNDYLAYRYYRFSKIIYEIFRRLWQILRYYITGGV